MARFISGFGIYSQETATPLTRSGLRASFYPWRASFASAVVVPSSSSWMSHLLQAA